MTIPVNLRLEIQRNPGQPKQNRYFNQWANGGCQRLLRVNTEDCNCDSNSQFLITMRQKYSQLLSINKEPKDTYEVIAGCSESLHNCHVIPEGSLAGCFYDFPLGKTIDKVESSGPHHHEVKDLGYEDTEDGSQVVDNSVALIREKYDDGVQKPKKRERREYWQKSLLKKAFARNEND